METNLSSSTDDWDAIEQCIQTQRTKNLAYLIGSMEKLSYIAYGMSLFGLLNVYSEESIHFCFTINFFAGLVLSTTFFMQRRYPKHAHHFSYLFSMIGGILTVERNIYYHPDIFRNPEP